MEFEQNLGLLDSNNRNSRRVLEMAKHDKDEAHDMMVHTRATLYQVVIELLNMT